MGPIVYHGSQNVSDLDLGCVGCGSVFKVVFLTWFMGLYYVHIAVNITLLMIGATSVYTCKHLGRL